MKKIFLAVSVLLAANASAQSAGDIHGFIEAKKYWLSNLKAYNDLSGGTLEYGVNLEVNIVLIPKYFDMMAGIDGAGTYGPGFTQGAGRLGFTMHAGRVDVSVYHRSCHSFDHTPNYWVTDQTFLNENNVSVRYNFGTQNP